MKKAYLDANILLALAAGKEKEPEQYRLAETILEEIKSGKIQAVISSLTLMEILAVLRAQKGREKNNLTGLSREKQVEFVIKESNSMNHILISELIRLPNVKFEFGRHVDLNKLMDQALEILKKVNGKVKFYNKCKRCGSENVNYSTYKGLGTDDMIHVLLAKDGGCDQLITFDGDFEEIKGFSEIEPLEIIVLKW